MNNKKYIIAIVLVSCLLVAMFLLARNQFGVEKKVNTNEWNNGYGITEIYDTDEFGNDVHSIDSREKGKDGEIIETHVWEVSKGNELIVSEHNIKISYKDGSKKEELSKETVNEDGSVTCTSETVINTKEGLLQQVEEVRNTNADKSSFYEKVVYETDAKGNLTIITSTESKNKNGKKTKSKVVVVQDKEGNIISQKNE